MRHKQFHLSNLRIVWDDLGCLRILRVPVLFPPIAGYSPGEIHTRTCALVVRLLRRPSNLQTSSLGSRPYIGSKSLAHFCCEFLNLQPLAESAFSKLPQLNKARFETSLAPSEKSASVLGPASEGNVAIRRNGVQFASESPVYWRGTDQNEPGNPLPVQRGICRTAPNPTNETTQVNPHGKEH